jgi:hypothetical protein
VAWRWRDIRGRLVAVAASLLRLGLFLCGCCGRRRRRLVVSVSAAVVALTVSCACGVAVVLRSCGDPLVSSDTNPHYHHPTEEHIKVQSNFVEKNSPHSPALHRRTSITRSRSSYSGKVDCLRTPPGATTRTYSSPSARFGQSLVSGPAPTSNFMRIRPP